MSARLEDQDEILLRQIHPQFMSSGRPASDRFRPQPKDAGKMSVDRGGLISADESHRVYTSNGRASGAVFGLSVSEFSEEKIGCYSDPLAGDKDHLPNLAHAYADYLPIPESQWKLISKRLAVKATQRGQLFP